MDDGSGSLPTLRDLAVETVEGLADVKASQDGLTTEYARDGHRFARLSGDVLDVRLEPFVATAALKTPDTSGAPDGPAWIRFAPASLDRFAADRVMAWIEHAWRHAND